MDLREAGAVDPDSHWYYRAKLRPLLEFVRFGPPPPEIVDVGAGSGFFGRRAAASCARRPRLTLVDSGYPVDEEPQPGVLRRRALPESVAQDSVVLLMDVLEHVDDDAGLLRDAAARCGRPCRFFITAPAFRALWSPHDDFLGHKRRYRLPELEAVARSAGLTVESGYYFFGLLLAPAWVKRRLAPSGGSELRPLPSAVERALSAACALELPLRRANRLAGLTCVVEASLS